MPVGVNLGSYLGQTVYVAFTYTRGNAGVSYRSDIAIDYLQVSTCELCASPGNILASNITTSSADLSWAAGGSETSWLMTINGTSTVQSSSTANLTGLTPNTNYSDTT